jgi:hypothetical protein
MIRLYQFARVWGTPNLSPFCCKVETYLRIAGIPYEVVSAIPPSAPKRKLPYIDDDGTAVSDKLYLLGDEPTTVDCSAFGLVSNIVWPPIESALKEHARGLDNLVAYSERIRDDYFGDLASPGA